MKNSGDYRCNAESTDVKMNFAYMLYSVEAEGAVFFLCDLQCKVIRTGNI